MKGKVAYQFGVSGWTGIVEERTYEELNNKRPGKKLEEELDSICKEILNDHCYGYWTKGYLDENGEFVADED